MGQGSSEFDLIARYFCLGVPSVWDSQGIGDDCAIVKIGETSVAITVDTVALGTHFFDDADPYTVGRKALAVNLSDLAAAGATPRAFFLAISLPNADKAWLERFSCGLKEEASRYGCALLGGDTTRTVSVNGMPASATMTITAMGEGQTLRTRQGAQVGDDIWVSGTLGDAYAALKMRWGHWTESVTDYLATRMDTPTPRVTLGQDLNGLAHASADVSDGFLADLGHILERSHLGAKLNVDAFAISADLARLSRDRQLEAILTGGDDYELVWTAPKSARERIKALASEDCPLSLVGEIVAEGLLVEDASGRTVTCDRLGFDHFG